MKPKRVGDIYALTCSVICGIGNIVAKGGLNHLSAEIFNFYLFLFAFIISAFLLFNRKQRKEILQTDLRTIGLISIIAVFFTFGIYFFIVALKLIEPATVSFLSRIEAVITVIIAYFILKERLTAKEILGGVIAIIGVLVLKYETTLSISRAASLMILSALFFAGAEIAVKKYIDRLGISRFLFYRNLITIPIMYLLLQIRGEPLYIPSAEPLLLTLGAAILFPILGRITYIQALKRIDISRTAFITQSMPLFTALFAFLILRTLPTGIEWLGGALILAGVIVVNLSGKKRE